MKASRKGSDGAAQHHRLLQMALAALASIALLVSLVAPVAAAPLSYTRTSQTASSVLTEMTTVAVTARPKHRKKRCLIGRRARKHGRPCLGAAASFYHQVGPDTLSQISYHEARIKRRLDIVHTYHRFEKDPRKNRLTPDEVYYASRRHTHLFFTWKPAIRWRDAHRSNRAYMARVHSMALSLKQKKVRHHKVLMAISHEPEDDVVTDPDCSQLHFKGHSGTPAQYRHMFRLTVKLLRHKYHVHNVRFVWNLMGSPNWNCMVKHLYPGNQYVSWISWDPYCTDGNFHHMVERFYHWLRTHSTKKYDFKSKPWMLSEWNSDRNYKQAAEYKLFRGAKQSIDHHKFKRIRAYCVFDSLYLGISSWAHTRNRRMDWNLNRVYMAFAHDQVFTYGY